MERKDYRLAAILYTDIAGFSKMMEKNEALTLELLNTHNRIIEDIVAAHGGKVIKTIGDAFLIDFRNTVDALQSAMEIQYQLYDYNKQHKELPLLVRIGVHMGDIYFYENDALGEGINISARLQSIAHPGCICMSQDVYNHVLNKVDFKAEKLGRVSLKNITKEIHAYEIATPNVEFDPNAAARTILVPDKEEKAVSDLSLPADADSPAPAPAASSVPSAEGGDKAADIKRRIMLDIKAAGKRLSIDQMRIRYGAEGPVAEEVILELAAKGLLLREAERTDERPVESERSAPFPRPAGRDEIVRAVNDLEYRIEDEVRKSLDAAFSGRRKRREQRDELRAARHGDGRWDGKVSESHFKSKADTFKDFDSYTQKTRSESLSSKAGFIAHLTAFIAVNGGLMALNAAVSPSFPWALFPFGGWAIGLLEHYASMLRKGERVRELAKMPHMDAERLSLFQQLQKKKDSIWLHLASTISTSAFLAMINLITSPHFLWFLFPAVGMGIGLLSHAGAYAGKKRELERAIMDSYGLSGSWSRAFANMPESMKDAPVDLGPYRTLVEEARAARAAILSLVTPEKGKKGKRGSAVSGAGVDADLMPTVDSYVEQVALLAKRTIEVDRIIELIPVDALRADRETLNGKLRDSPGNGLRREYEKSIAELDKQETSYKELKDQREVMELRLKSSVNTIKQMHIDLARLSGMPAGGENASVNVLRDKTLELNRYLGDLRAGYEELDALEARAFPSAEEKTAE
ncbi:MAG: adenylate/guanylate cyclase domain-containing protein [Treponemataceae bacterium]